jgi:hypothetical protein
MGAGLRTVRLASLAGVDILPVSSSGNTLGGEKLPGTRRLTTVAAHGEAARKAGAASKSILGGQDGGGITSLDAATVIVGLGGAECPARSAVGLITHHASDGGTLGPVGTDIKSLRDSSRGGKERLLLQLRLEVSDLVREHGSQEVLHITNGGILKLSVGTGLPSGSLGVDLGDHGGRSGVHGGAQVEGRGANEGGDEKSRLHFDE